MDQYSDSASEFINEAKASLKARLEKVQESNMAQEVETIREDLHFAFGSNPFNMLDWLSKLKLPDQLFVKLVCE